jgi:hypothetical protein
MKALSLWQPWADWILQGWKTIETRTWATHYRGPLLICAARRYDSAAYAGRFAPNQCRWSLYEIKCRTGIAVAVCRLVDCRPMAVQDERAACYEWEAGRWAWLLEDVRPVNPFHVRGRQRLFDVEFQMEAGAQ